jgi:hypothetical protein
MSTWYPIEDHDQRQTLTKAVEQYAAMHNIKPHRIGVLDTTDPTVTEEIREQILAGKINQLAVKIGGRKILIFTEPESASTTPKKSPVPELPIVETFMEIQISYDGGIDHDLDEQLAEICEQEGSSDSGSWLGESVPPQNAERDITFELDSHDIDEAKEKARKIITLPKVTSVTIQSTTTSTLSFEGTTQTAETAELIR